MRKVITGNKTEINLGTRKYDSLNLQGEVFDETSKSVAKFVISKAA